MKDGWTFGRVRLQEVAKAADWVIRPMCTCGPCEVLRQFVKDVEEMYGKQGTGSSKP